MAEWSESEPDDSALSRIPGRIRPTAHSGRWISAGLVLQLAGVGGPVAYVWTKAKHQDVGGLITVATVKLAWRQSLHAKTGVEVLVGGAALFTIGSVLLARPFAKHWLTLLAAVPIAALCGALVLGVAALLVTLLFLLISDGDGFDAGGFFDGGGGGRRARRPPGSPPEDSPDQVDGTSF